MSCTISVLSTDSAFHSASVVVTTEYSRFLFDVGEGTQRLVMEHKVRVGKVHAVCTTSAHIRCLGGITGMLLTLGDAGVGKLDVLGPLGVKKFLAGVNNFTRPLDNYSMPVIDEKTQSIVPYVAKDLTLYPVALGLSQVGLENCRHFCYIGETPQIAGKFFVEKAVELGVPKGPIFGKLKNGSAVTLPDGRVIEPWQVLGEPTLSQYFAIVPSLTEQYDQDHLQYLYQDPHLSQYQVQDPEHSRVMQVMVHLSPRATVISKAYSQWMASFGKSVKHIFIGEGMSHDASETAYIAERVYNQKLASLYPVMFPDLLSPTASSLSSESTVQQEESGSALSQEQVIAGRTMLKYAVLPLKRAGIDASEVPVSPDTVIDTNKETFLQSVDPVLLQRAVEYRTKMMTDLTTSNVHTESPEHVRFYFLGTGCAIPSKYRNVSSTLVFLQVSASAILFDCGEGTWHQLLRLRPPTLSTTSSAPTSTTTTTVSNYAEEWARIIKLVWISHLHADHHLGLVNLILQRKVRLSTQEFRPLFVIAPMYVLRFLEEVSVMMPEITDAFVGIPSNCFDPTDLICTDCVSEESIIAQLQRNSLDTNTFVSQTKSSSSESQTVSATSAYDPKTEKEYGEEETTDSTEDQKSEETLVDEEELLRKRRKLRDFRYRPRIITSATNGTTTATTTATASTSPFFPSAKVVMHTIATAFKDAKQLLQEMGIVELINVPVIHCIQANGLVLSVRKVANHTSEGRNKEEDDDIMKIVYSGDTRPSETLIYWGQDAQILLHEATFEDDKAVEAYQKKHSTINEAVEVARLMHAPHLILTHFSQRYHGIPMQFHPQFPVLWQQQQQQLLLQEEDKQQKVDSTGQTTNASTSAGAIGEAMAGVAAVSNVVVAFDFMTVSDRELHWAKGLTPLLAEIFPALPAPGEDNEEDLNIIGKEDEKTK